MRFASLGSGSSGNATVIEYKSTCLLVDCGFTLKEVERRMQRLDRHPSDLTAILVTHEHSDHIRGVGPLARKYRIPVYLTPGTHAQSRLGTVGTIKFINSSQRFTIDGIDVEPVIVPHDAREPCQFVFRSQDKALGVLTDLGSITPFVAQRYDALHGLLLECNHDVDMLQTGPYPPALKRRVGGDYGHLNNVQAAQLLERIEISQLQHLVVSHISQQNNTPELACDALSKVLGNHEKVVTVADQEQGFGWLHLD